MELLTGVATVALLASLTLPALNKAKTRGQSVFCLNNSRQLTLAWTLYSQENEDRLACNLGAGEIKRMLAENRHYNWANSVLDWETTPDNTNAWLNTDGALGGYLSRNAGVFKCPADRALSDLQRPLGWTSRSRSVSMNAMVGDAGEFTRNGTNSNNPYLHQYRKMHEFGSAGDIFVFVEEHPDSINDGYFLNKAPDRSGEIAPQWTDLPASHHAGAANLSFGDGHSESHRWKVADTRKPARPQGANLPFPIPNGDRGDFDWLMQRTSTKEKSGYSYSSQ